MSVKFNVQMTDQYMYDFMLYHNYTHASGLMTAIAGVLCLAVFVQKLMDGEKHLQIYLNMKMVKKFNILFQKDLLLVI